MTVKIPPRLAEPVMEWLSKRGGILVWESNSDPLNGRFVTPSKNRCGEPHGPPFPDAKKEPSLHIRDHMYVFVVDGEEEVPLLYYIQRLKAEREEKERNEAEEKSRLQEELEAIKPATFSNRYVASRRIYVNNNGIGDWLDVVYYDGEFIVVGHNITKGSGPAIAFAEWTRFVNDLDNGFSDVSSLDGMSEHLQWNDVNMRPSKFFAPGIGRLCEALGHVEIHAYEPGDL